MSIRVLACYLFVLGFSIYAWRNWFVSLCAAILLMAVVEHPDMPNSVGGIQGLNPWNILMASVLVAWVSRRRQDGLAWDMPRHMKTLLWLYFLVVLVGFVRLVISHENFGAELGLGYITSEYFINTIKWTLPGVLMFDACRSRDRVQIALLMILALYVLLAIQVIRWVPLSAATGSGDFQALASKIIQREIGYNRVTLSMVLGGASWAILAALVLGQNKWHKLGLLVAAGLVAFGQALTGGRIGYACWATVGLILSLVRWRKFLLLIPVGVAGVAFLLPSVWDRILQGVGGTSGAVVIQSDDYELTSGRTLIWPYVIEKIGQAPGLGYGREAMVTTGLAGFLLEDMDEDFAHPHNAYFQILMDSGIVGLVPVVLFFIVILYHAFRLLRDRDDPLCSAVGGAVCALVLALLIGAVGGQTFYPREAYVGMWAAMFLMLRVSVERQYALAASLPLFEGDVAEAAYAGQEPYAQPT